MNAEDTAYDIFVDLDPVGQCNLLLNSRTAQVSLRLKLLGHRAGYGDRRISESVEAGEVSICPFRLMQTSHTPLAAQSCWQLGRRFPAAHLFRRRPTVALALSPKQRGKRAR